MYKLSNFQLETYAEKLKEMLITDQLDYIELIGSVINQSESVMGKGIQEYIEEQRGLTAAAILGEITGVAYSIFNNLSLGEILIVLGAVTGISIIGKEICSVISKYNIAKKSTNITLNVYGQVYSFINSIFEENYTLTDEDIHAMANSIQNGEEEQRYNSENKLAITLVSFEEKHLPDIIEPIWEDEVLELYENIMKICKAQYEGYEEDIKYAYKKLKEYIHDTLTDEIDANKADEYQNFFNHYKNLANVMVRKR